MRKTFSVLMVMLLAAAISPVQAQVSGLPDFTHLVETAGPAVVNIRVTQFGSISRPGRGGADNDSQEEIPEFFRRFFDTPNDPRFGRPDRSGAGSGFIYDSSGYIITNHHVIEDADQIIVRLADRREFEAELVGSDELSDIALLKIDAINLPALKFGSAEALRPGEWVAAIGSPFNFEQSITSGIVSAKGRSNGSQQYVPFIQTDVAINQGNSGGPLFNLDGDVVGVNTAIFSPTGTSVGISFSIPSDIARQVVGQLLEFGETRRGWIGIWVQNVDSDMAQAFGLNAPRGAVVNRVEDDSPAAEAGLVPGDLILAFNGEPVANDRVLPIMVASTEIGTLAPVDILRRGEAVTLEVEVDR